MTDGTMARDMWSGLLEVPQQVPANMDLNRGVQQQSLGSCQSSQLSSDHSLLFGSLMCELQLATCMH